MQMDCKVQFCIFFFLQYQESDILIYNREGNHMHDNFVKGIRIHKLEEQSYLNEIEGLKKFDHLSFDQPITFFVGENGSGKSTLLEAIAVALGFNAEGGSKNFNFSTCDTHSNLDKALSISRGGHRERDGFFLRSESLYNLATYLEEINGEFEFSEYGDTSIHHQSHGEGCLNLVKYRFRGNGLYLLDEPEAGLSFQRQLALLSLIHNLASTDSQFIIVTHSPILLALPNSKIYSFDLDSPPIISLEECESYEILNLFMNNRETLMKHLLGDEE